MSNDLISRKALKKEFETLFYNDCGDFVRTERLIDDAPTVELEPNDCVLKMFGECSYKETGCSDCLVKEKIRNALANNPTVYEFKGCDNCELDRPKGKWIECNSLVEYKYMLDGNEYFKCSECQCCCRKNYNYCPNCGADMRKEDQTT